MSPRAISGTLADAVRLACPRLTAFASARPELPCRGLAPSELLRPHAPDSATPPPCPPPRHASPSHPPCPASPSTAPAHTRLPLPHLASPPHRIPASPHAAAPPLALSRAPHLALPRHPAAAPHPVAPRLVVMPHRACLTAAVPSRPASPRRAHRVPSHQVPSSSRRIPPLNHLTPSMSGRALAAEPRHLTGTRPSRPAPSPPRHPHPELRRPTRRTVAGQQTAPGSRRSQGPLVERLRLGLGEDDDPALRLFAFALAVHACDRGHGVVDHLAFEGGHGVQAGAFA